MWRIQVKVRVPDSFGYGWHYEWKDLRPSGNKNPYEYETKIDALNIRNMCYPEQTNDEVRVYQVK